MNQYSIYCSEEQTKRAYKLGAPILRYKSVFISESVPHYKEYLYGDKYIFVNPTAEQMCGWLRGKGYHTESSRIGQERFIPICVVGRTDIANDIVYPTYNEALFAAIETALEHIEKKGSKEGAL